jgi:hypothetical protein
MELQMTDRDTIQDASVAARGIVQGILELRDLARHRCQASLRYCG